MNLEIQTTTISGEVNFLDSEQIRVIKRGVTIDYTTVPLNDDNKRILEAGSRLGQITASSKFAPVINTTNAAEAADSQGVIELNDLSNIQVGDTLVIEDDTNSDSHAVESIDDVAGTVTLDANLSNIYAVGSVVRKDDGSQNAKVILFPHDVDVTDGDSLASGIDMARVIEARLPGSVSDNEKADLNFIKFV
jgi:hypothetical protein